MNQILIKFIYIQKISKYQLLIKKRESTGFKYSNGAKLNSKIIWMIFMKILYRSIEFK